MSTQIFVDFWNLSLQWRDATEQDNRKRLDWKVLPKAFLAAAKKAADVDMGAFSGVRVYASYDTSDASQAKLRNWLDGTLDRMPGYSVQVRERQARRRPIHCRECDTSTDSCPACKKPFQRSAEKGVDAAIVTDMFSLAWEKAYEVAILVSSDGDFVPAVERLQEKGIKVINATWRGHGHQLAKTCWASFCIDDLIPELTRANP